jgi:hypothetical protein
MGTISRSGITGGGTIQAVHITNIIDALDGTSATTTVVATGSFNGTLVGTASFAANSTSALSASYAATASYALNGGSGGSGIFALTGSVYSTTNTLQVTGSLRVTAGVTASLQGTSSYSISSLSSSYSTIATQAEVVRTTTNALYYPVIVDSANANATSEALQSTANISINPSTGAISSTAGLSITGSFKVSQSLTVSPGASLYVSSSTIDGAISGSNNFIMNLTNLGKDAGRGTFVLPINQPTYPVRGSVYVDFDGFKLYLYDGSSWVSIGIV